MGEKELIRLRVESGLLNIGELQKMFGIGRHKIDDAVNSGELKYISPNNRTKYIELEDFKKWAGQKEGGKSYGK